MTQFPQVPRVDLARWRWLCALYSIASRLIGKHMVSIWTLPTIYTQELLAQKPPRPSRPLDNPKGRAQWYLLGNSHQTSHAKPGEHPININPQQSRSTGYCTRALIRLHHLYNRQLAGKKKNNNNNKQEALWPIKWLCACFYLSHTSHSKQSSCHVVQHWIQTYLD